MFRYEVKKKDTQHSFFYLKTSFTKINKSFVL